MIAKQVLQWTGAKPRHLEKRTGGRDEDSRFEMQPCDSTKHVQVVCGVFDIGCDEE